MTDFTYKTKPKQGHGKCKDRRFDAARVGKWLDTQHNRTLWQCTESEIGDLVTDR